MQHHRSDSRYAFQAPGLTGIQPLVAAHWMQISYFSIIVHYIHDRILDVLTRNSMAQSLLGIVFQYTFS